MTSPRIELTHLDNLWLQVTGTLCNLTCTHCFNNSGPAVRTFGFLSFEQFEGAVETALHAGVKEIFFTGGEPFLHPRIYDMVTWSLDRAPTTVLTNATLIDERAADRLANIEQRGRYSLELRVSLDSFDERENDALRGHGVFSKVVKALALLSQRSLLPLVTVVRTWNEDEEPAVLPGFVRILQEAGYERPRIKILPALPLGRELVRAPGDHREPLLTEEMLRGFDRELLMCSNSRIVTDRGVWVCPLLVEKPDAKLGEHLADSARVYELRHRTCYSCYQFGTICGNVNVEIEGTSSGVTPGGGRR